MIPKKIHYCWFGGKEKPKLAKKCINSWKKFCPDYEIIEWNENNFDVTKYPFTQYCYENKKWAFLSDFVRLVVVYENGGIYFDTDVESIKPLDDLLSLPAFYGFETEEYINTGHGFGAEKGNDTVLSMINCYLQLPKDEKGDFPLIACPKLNTKALISFGIQLNGEQQDLGQAVVFPIDYFNPYDDPTGKLNKTNNTYSIHWYNKSWILISRRLITKMVRPFRIIFGRNVFTNLKRGRK